MLGMGNFPDFLRKNLVPGKWHSGMQTSSLRKQAPVLTIQLWRLDSGTKLEASLIHFLPSCSSQIILWGTFPNKVLPGVTNDPWKVALDWIRISVKQDLPTPANKPNLIPNDIYYIYHRQHLWSHLTWNFCSISPLPPVEFLMQIKRLGPLTR